MRIGERVVVGVLAGMLASGPLVGRMPAIAEPTPQAPEVKAAYEKVAKAGADDFMKAYKTQKAFPKGGAYFSQETIAKAQVRIEKTKAEAAEKDLKMATDRAKSNPALAAKLARQEKIREEANTILADAKAEANQLKAEAEKKFLEKLSPAITKIQAAEKEKAAAMDAQTLAEGKLKDASKGKEAKAAEKALADAKLKVDAANKLIFVAAGEGIALQVRRRPCSVWPLP